MQLGLCCAYPSYGRLLSPGKRRKEVFYRQNKVKQKVKEGETDDHVFITAHWAQEGKMLRVRRSVQRVRINGEEVTPV